MAIGAAPGCCDVDDLTARTAVNPELGAEQLLVRHQQVRIPLDHASDAVGQPAIGIRHVWAALEQEDVCVLVQSAQSGRTRCTARYTTNDYDSHAAEYRTGRR
jgi:hypothetical protein